ncbi:MAG: glycosyltransferase family 4 protein [Pseudomonadota bacterium]
MTAKDPIKVLHVIYGLSTGGAEIYIRETSRAALAEGYFKPSVLGWRKGGDLESDFAAIGAPASSLNFEVGGLTAPLKFRALVRRIADEIVATGADVVHGHLTDGALLAVLAGRLADTPVAVTAHSNHVIPMSLKTGGFKHTLWRVLTGWAYKRADALLAISPQVQASIMSTLGAPKEKISITPIGVAPAIPSRPRAEVRDELGVDADADMLVFVGRLAQNKNQAGLVRAMPDLLRQRPKALLVLVGDGPDAERLKELSHELGVGDRVVLAGARSDIADLLGASDVFVTASRSEGVSLAVLEAFSCGLPVVSTDVDGNRELLSERCGLLTPEDAPQKMAQTLADLLGDDATRALIGQKAQARWRDHYRLEAATLRLAEVYARLAGVDAPRSEQTLAAVPAA